MANNSEGGTDDAYALIDPTVGPYSSADEIQEWINELRTYPSQTTEVKEAIIEAESWLELQDK